MSKTAEDIRQLLIQIANLSVSSSTETVTQHSNHLMSLLLKYGSDTPDNHTSIENVELAKVQLYDTAPERIGLQTVQSKTELSEILSACEVTGIPSEIQKEFPNLSEKEWSSCFRICILLLSVLEPSNL